MATLEMQAVIGRYSTKKMFLEVSTGKHLHRSLFFSKVAGINPATLLKKTLRHRCFPVNFAKFLRVPFLQNTSGRRFLLKRANVLQYLLSAN